MEKRRASLGLRYILLLPPYFAMLWVASYNKSAPALAGIPFFYWYQLLWIPLGVLLLYPLYRMGRRKDRRQ
jgi:membrane protein implicated in regulation of membrane protease activity